MPRRCSVCTHPEREGIDHALIAGEPLRTVSDRFGPSKTALIRHKTEHLPVALVQAQHAESAAQADSLLDQVRDLEERSLAILRRAETAGQLPVALMAIREARGCVELLAKLTRQLDDRPSVNVLVAAPEWLTARSALLAALMPYPEARAAVAERLQAIEAGV